MLRIPAGRRLTSWLFTSVEELNSGPPKTNPSSGREQDLNPGPPDYKSSALTTRPRCLLRRHMKEEEEFFFIIILMIIIIELSY